MRATTRTILHVEGVVLLSTYRLWHVEDIPDKRKRRGPWRKWQLASGAPPGSNDNNEEDTYGKDQCSLKRGGDHVALVG